MADNITLPGTGSVMATDDIGGVHYQIVKLGVGALNTATALELGQAVMASSLPVALASNQTALLTQRTGFVAKQTLTVTNGAYTAGDVVGGLITLTSVASAVAKHVRINTITLGAVAALAYELWFFTADIATPAADNAAFTLVAADEALCVGVVPIPAANYCAAASAFNVATVKDINMICKTGAATTSLYAYLKTTVTTTPATTTLYLRVAGERLD